MMRDLRGVAPRARVGGQWATFTGFEHRKDEECCIDFVFGRSDGGWCVVSALYPTEVGIYGCALGRRRACSSRRRFRTMGCSRVTIVSSSQISSVLN